MGLAVFRYSLANVLLIIGALKEIKESNYHSPNLINKLTLTYTSKSDPRISLDVDQNWRGRDGRILVFFSGWGVTLIPGVVSELFIKIS